MSAEEQRAIQALGRLEEVLRDLGARTKLGRGDVYYTLQATVALEQSDFHTLLEVIVNDKQVWQHVVQS